LRRLLWDISVQLESRDLVGGAEAGGLWYHDEQSSHERGRVLRELGATITEPTSIGLVRLYGPADQLQIGQNCMVQHRVSLVTDGWAAVTGPGHWRGTGIRILDNTAVFQGSWIMPGVTIGPNSMVSPGSVVSRDVPSGCVAMGNPARAVMSLDMWARRVQARLGEHPEEFLDEPLGLRVHQTMVNIGTAWLATVRTQRERRGLDIGDLPTPARYRARYQGGGKDWTIANQVRIA
jgi:carbonic anhydrase/acetyltransferase-like protein (isoleucine patch superfamily)